MLFTGTPDVRLDEFDRDEWREVTRLVRPDWSDEDFDRAWTEFLDAKRRGAMH